MQKLKPRSYDFFEMCPRDSQNQSTDSFDFIWGRAESIFYGAKNDLFSDFDKAITKQHSLWNRSQKVAIVRAKWDQPIGIVRQLLSFCTTKSLEENKNHIIDYFIECYDWIDLAVAIRIFESIAHPEYAHIMDGISFDRHYNNNRERYSDGKSGEPYLTINMLDNLSRNDLDIFAKECFDIIYSNNLPKPKINEATPQLVRAILVRNMHFLYDIKPKQLMDFINFIFDTYDENDELFEYVSAADKNMFYSYNEQNISNDFRKFNREFEQDWFRSAIKTFEYDRMRNWDMYQKHYVSTMTKHGAPNNIAIPYGTNLYMLDDQKYKSEDEKMQRFELIFNKKQSLFSLRKI